MKGDIGERALLQSNPTQLTDPLPPLDVRFFFAYYAIEG
jgi:hypothetical protein